MSMQWLVLDMASVVNSRNVERWLGKKLQIELVDGRLIEGRFVCTDNHPNIILAGAEERWSEQESSSEEIHPSEEESEKDIPYGEEIPLPDNSPRQIGLVMVARDQLRAIRVLDQTVDDTAGVI